MIKDHGIVTALSWVKDLLSFPSATRKRIKEQALKSIQLFKLGKRSKEADEFIKGLGECEFIGFAPNISYIKMKGTSDDLQSIFVHPFSSPSLVYKVKGCPALLITNAYIDFNKTRLEKIPHNKFQDSLKGIIKDVRGITG